MIQADLRTARMHPDHGMNGFILAAIVIAALAALGALAHVLDGLFFISRASSAFIRFVSVWDIAFAFLGYLTCAAGLSRHRIFPWLYLGFAIGYAVPRVMLEIQAHGLDVGMSAMHQDQSFLQQTHILQLLALMTCLAAVYVLWSPAVRITYRHRLTRDEERLVEQMQGADPRLSRGPQGQDEDLRVGRSVADRRPAGRFPGGSPRVGAPDAVGSEDAGAGPALVRRRARGSANAPLPPPAPADPALPDAAESLPALPSFFQPAPDAGAGAADAATAPKPDTTIGRTQGMDGDQHAAALAAATVAGALQRVSESEAAVAPEAAMPQGAPLGTQQANAPGDEASDLVIVRSGRRRSGGVPTGIASAPAREDASAAAGAIIAGAQRRSDGTAATAGPGRAWASTASSQAAAPAGTGPEGVHGAAAGQGADPTEGPATVLSDPVATAAPPASDEPAVRDAFSTAGQGGAYDAMPPDDNQHDDAMRRQLDAEEARQKLQEELEIDRRIARLRGLATGQVSALSIGLAMDRNPLADDDEDSAPTASDGAVRSTTDERLGRLRAAAAPPRSRGDSVRRRDEQSLSDSVGEVVHGLAKGDDESELTQPAAMSAAPPLAISSRGATDGGFQSRIDALLSRVDASNAWQGGSLPEEVTEQAEADGATPAEPSPSPEPSRPPDASMAEPSMAVPSMPGSAVPPHLDPDLPDAAGQPPLAIPEVQPVRPAAAMAPDKAVAEPEPPGNMPAPSVGLPTVRESAVDVKPGHAPTVDRDSDWPAATGVIPGLAPMSAPEAPPRDGPAPEPVPQPAAAEAAPSEVASPDAVAHEAAAPEPASPEPASPDTASPDTPPAGSEDLPQAAPIDKDDLARSLAEILPAVDGPVGHPAEERGPAAAAVPAAAASRDEAMTAVTAESLGPAGTDRAPQPGDGNGQAGASPGLANEAPATSREGAADDEAQVSQRIDAMRILVDEGFMSAEEFEKRSAALRGGG